MVLDATGLASSLYPDAPDTAIAGIPEVVIDGETGVLLDDPDPAQLAAAVNDELRDYLRGRRRDEVERVLRGSHQRNGRADEEFLPSHFEQAHFGDGSHVQ